MKKNPYSWDWKPIGWNQIWKGKTEKQLSAQVNSFQALLALNTTSPDTFPLLRPSITKIDQSFIGHGFIQQINGTYLFSTPISQSAYDVDFANPTQYENGSFMKVFSSDHNEPSGYLYLKYIEPSQLILGAFYTDQEFHIRLKSLIINRIQAYYEDKERYIFINDYDSTALVAVRKDLVGKKFDQLDELDGASIHHKIMALLNQQDSGFIHYQFIDKNNNQASEKISYVYNLKEWEVYIGIGFYIDALKQDIDKFNLKYLSYFYNETLLIIVLLMVLSLIIFALFQRGAYLQKKYSEQDDVIFEKLFEVSGQSIAVISLKGKLIHQNKLCQELFDNQIERFITGNKLSFQSLSNNLYVININGESLYIRYKLEKSIFKGIDSHIYIFEDVSALHLQTAELKQIALSDALTKLPNRYALSQDFETLCRNHANPLIIGILDIDHFKSVNDTYGHQIGDEVLKLLAITLKENLSERDNVYRYGGEEFVLLIVSDSLVNVKNTLEHINARFKINTQSHYGFEKTFSCGLVKVNLNETCDLKLYIHEADTLLYQAKNLGRNRVEILLDE